jgi:large subunit ribosomal protein L15
MKYNELQIDSHRRASRVGRGISAGQGKTAGRGTKGQKSRTGKTRRPGFEGGQNPLMQRLPKLRGFRSYKTKMELVYTGDLNDLKGTVTNESVAAAGLVSSPYVRVKLVQRGELSAKVTVSLQAASQGAVEAIQKAGGSFSVVAQQGRQAKVAAEEIAKPKRAAKASTK